jgi:pyruvate,phosphate dikinase
VTYSSIYRFSVSNQDWLEPDEKTSKKILGGKGAGLVTMCLANLPVPPGFTITTQMCNQYREFGIDQVARNAWVTKLMGTVVVDDAWLAEQFTFAPLVSVRSGAPISMPGMMDTILNVGLCSNTMDFWAKRLGPRAANDSYRRLIQMLGHTAYGVPMEVFDFQMAKLKKAKKVKLDTELTASDLEELCADYLKAFLENKGFHFPDTREEQLEAAIRAVFESWMNPRAIEYRKINKIDEAMGTAVTVQAMVFGNMGEDSGSGVLFTRDPSTGENKLMGEYLANAQGEDVVAGIRTPDKLENQEGQTWWPVLGVICQRLEEMYLDMVDVEFTVQQGKLYILQSRAGKRSAQAAVKIAVDLVKAGVIDKDTAFKRVSIDQFKIARRPNIAPNFKVEPNGKGLPACPGVAVGKPVFTSVDAVNCTEPCILVTHETTPDDIAGMNKALGILTQTGGATSHAAVVARAMDKPCVVGCTDLDFSALKKAKKLTVDGATGRFWVDVDVPVIDSSDAPEMKTLMQWCMDSLGFIPQETVDRDDGLSHRIMVSHWWGDTDVLSAVLDGIAAMEDRSKVFLDCKPPTQHYPKSDGLLLDLFYQTSVDETLFNNVLLEQLEARSYELKGLVLLNIATEAKHPSHFASLGYTVVGTPDNVGQLLSMSYVTLTLEFINKIAGGYEAWTKLQKILSDAGVNFSAVPEAVPADYCAFTVLSR